GSSVTFDLTVASPVVEAVELSLDGVPTGWEATLRGGGFVVHSVTTNLDTPPKTTLQIDVPADATPGPYPITINAVGDSGTTSTVITLNIAAQVNNAIEVTADFPKLSGGPDAAFTYSLKIVNNTPEEQTFTFSPTGPEGWTVTASPTAEAQAATVTIAAGASGQLSVKATPPATVPEGSYPIQVDVAAANGATGSIQLTAEVTGTPQLSLTTSDQRLDASGKANTEKRVPLIVSNTGSAELTGVQLAGTAPTGWDISFDPKTVASVKPGETAQVTAIITPKAGAVAGDYAMTVRASAGSQSSNIDLRFTLKGSRTIGVFAVIVIIAAIGALIGVFVRFGRR
ncbi:MAG: hypothetical protein JWN99_1201, partial [Ilumatobacteraceae bacterium]|nr:hypothetical protein [Ilumatobacteraceae bacterium]